MKKLKPLPGKMNPCLCCPPIPAVADLQKIVAVGFGSAIATCNGELVADGEEPSIIKNGKKRKLKRFITFGDIEQMALLRPRADWRIKLDGPLHGETYQRHGKGKWLLVEKNNGFA